ncbi:hypothetical protein PybrP1_002904 [[Pythium] brassicae (nom. inval.)]|nr:hypothetical protein PybrP1_002904 [[Pythium] brassicae (nom. inval.)]
MFLRTLYGSRMPQALHPRADPQISSYWQEDTESSREIARVVAEAEALDGDADAPDDLKKSVLAVSGGADAGLGRGSRRALQLSTQLLSQLGPGAPGLEDMTGLRVEDMPHSPVPAQLSPSGLISIAAADIDEAAGQRLPPNAALDWSVVEALRRSGREASSADSADVAAETRGRRRMSIFEDALAQVIALPTGSAALAPQSEGEAEAQSQLRFLSLLRRINELRSQQVDHDSWDGLPYPQILALPTFKFTAREPKADGLDEPQINNSLCAVCYTDFVPDEEVRALPCLHFYHRECIDQWLLHHRMCPICKHVVAVY